MLNWLRPKVPCRYCSLNPATYTGACQFCQAKVDEAIQVLVLQLKERIEDGSQGAFIVGLKTRID